MSKELVGQITPTDVGPLPPVPDPSAGVSKAFLSDLKGKQGEPGVVDPVAVGNMVADYLEENPAGLYVQTHIQSEPAAVWVITHSLPFQPAVSVIDSAGTRIETEIVYDSPTQIRSIASAGFSGTAYLS